MISAETIGIKKEDKLFIEKLVTLMPSESIDFFMIAIRQNISDTSTAHYIFLGVVFGRMIAARSMQSKTNKFLLCSQN